MNGWTDAHLVAKRRWSVGKEKVVGGASEGRRFGEEEGERKYREENKGFGQKQHMYFCGGW